MNRPVSVTSPTYSASAIGWVSVAPRSPSRSQITSAVHEASGTTWFTVPKRVLSWWWSRLRMRAACLSASAGLRSMLPQSRKITRAPLEVVGQLGDELGQHEEAVLVGQRELVRGEERDRVLAQAAEHVLHGGQGPEGVAVGVLVRGEDEAVAVAQRVEHQGARGGVAVQAHASPSSCSSSRRAMRRPRSVVSS